MASSSGPYILQTGAAYDPESDLQQSPLWPLQAALRAKLAEVTDPDVMASLQNAVVTIETSFSKWRINPSLTFIRSVVRSILEQTDVSDDPALVTLKSQALSLPQWNDPLAT